MCTNEYLLIPKDGVIDILSKFCSTPDERAEGRTNVSSTSEEQMVYTRQQKQTVRYLSPLALLPEISGLENALIGRVGHWGTANIGPLPAPFIFILRIFPAIRPSFSNCRQRRL